MSASGRSQLTTALSVGLGLLLVVGLAGLAVFVIAPVPAAPADTEFYVLGPDGQAGNYSSATVGEPKQYTVGVENQEHERVRYRIVLRNGEEVITERTRTLDDGERWEAPVEVTYDETGRQRVDILLYRSGSDNPYRKLYVIAEVSGTQSQ